MPKRSSIKKSAQKKQKAAISLAIRQSNNAESHQKNPAAVALGRLGGKRGGKARAEKLSAKRRREIAKLAALARWSKE
jgi:hypothetical protein